MTYVESLVAALAALAPDVIDADGVIAAALIDVLVRVVGDPTCLIGAERVTAALAAMQAGGRFPPSLPGVQVH